MVNMYDEEKIKETYRSVLDLQQSRDIIQTYSINNDDIREVAIHGLELSHVRSVLDLGCGYGFFIEKLKGVLHPDTEITGVDITDNNRGPYLEMVRSRRYTGSFINANADIIKGHKNNAYDCIIACYSLYFFTELIPEITRILKQDGVFIAVTHSRFSLDEIISLIPECMRELGIYDNETIEMKRMFASFSMENGTSKLRPYFSSIENIRFKNTMLFPSDDVEDCIRYITKKRHLLYNDSIKDIDAIEALLLRKVRAIAREKGVFPLTKDDMIFRCTGPTTTQEIS